MMDRDDRELFERSIRHAMTAHTGAALDGALAELGWLDALAVDPRTAVSTLFAVQGEANTTSAALDDVLAGALGIKAEPGTVAVVLPPLGDRTPPAAIEDDQLVGRGLGTGAVDVRDTAVVVAGLRDPVAVLVDPSDVARSPVAGLDPRLRWSTVALELAGTGDTQPAAWADAVAAGQLALGHELVGAARAMLALARAHAVDRVQFGRTISGFQAVRHRLAESLVAIEAADAALAAAWETPSRQTAAMGKALAGRNARIVARHCQQVLAGIGFTTDHTFHRYLRRVLVLDETLGSARTLTAELGEDLIRTRQLPVPLPL
jgi:hypothetical protein